MERAEFEALIRHNWALIREIARRFDTGSGVEDICQDVVLVAWRKRGDVLDPAGFGAWVRAIALNVGRAHSRRRNIWTRPVQAADAAAPDPTAEIADRHALETALRELSERERETVEARYLKGWSLAEIAFSLNEPVGTTKSRLSRARGKLRSELRRIGWTRFGRGDAEEEDHD